MARPSKYREEFAEQAKKLCALGATAPDLATFFGVAVSTVKLWQVEHRAFSDARGTFRAEQAKAAEPCDDDYYARALRLIRQDLSGVSAARKRRRQEQKRRSATPSKRIRDAVSTRMWAALKGRKDFKLFSRLNYSLDELMSHLEGLFQPGMTWANYGRWHVDHRRPCAAFDLTKEDQFAQCWALANLQPLWAEDNIRKGAR